MDYKEQVVFSIRPNFVNIAVGQVDDFTYEAQGEGAATPWKPTTKLKRRVSMPFIFNTREEHKRIRGFWDSRRGRLRGFWLPLHTNDYPLMVDAVAGATEIVIQNVGYADKWSVGTQFQHIALITPSKLECYGVTDVEVDGETEILTLDAPLETDLVARVTKCSALIYARFADKEVEYEYHSDNVCLATLNFVELPTETLSPDFGEGPEGEVHAGSLPLNLYRFTLGLDVYYSTNWPTQITAGLEDWAPENIKHDVDVSSVEFLNEPIELTVATDDPAHPLRAFLNRFYLQKCKIEIFETDAETLSVDLTKPLFVGRLGRPQFQRGGVISVSISSVFRIAEEKGPNFLVGRTCQNTLFDFRCGLNDAAYITTGTVSDISISASWIEAPEFATKATAEADPNWFALGKVTFGQQVRTCVGQVADRLYLNAPFVGLTIGSEVDARPGCDKLSATCEGKFNNLENLLGFEYIPNKDPQFEALETPKAGGGKKS